jgi:DNA-binding GntR family transcriptional regulator
VDGVMDRDGRAAAELLAAHLSHTALTLLDDLAPDHKPRAMRAAVDAAHAHHLRP